MKKNILITGASGNLGKAVVEIFLSEGWYVIATVSPGSAMGSSDPVSLTTYEADLSNEKSVEEVINKIIQDHKTIDAAVLTVGGYAPGTIETTDAAALQKMISLNFNTSYFVARPVFRQMLLQSSGRIVFIGSRQGLEPKEGTSTIAYTLSKSLIFKLADLLNADAAGKNIVSSVIVPGTIDTPANRAANPNADFSSWVAPKEIAKSIHFLISEDSRALREPVLKMYSNA